MQQDVTKLIRLISFAAWMSFGAKAVAESSDLSDRVVVEINRIPYTQRTIEVYHLVKYGISTQPEISLIDTGSWQLVVKDFVEGMLIDQSNSAQGLFRPNANAVQMANANWTKRIDADNAFKQHVDRLALRHQELQRIIVQVFRIESVRRSKSTETSRQEVQARRPGGKPKADGANWIDSLRASAVIRFYDLAARYEPIRWHQ